MMATPDPPPQRPVPVEFTPIWLHAQDCTESAQDLQRMRDLLEEDPSLLYNVQPKYSSRLNRQPAKEGDSPPPVFKRIHLPPYDDTPPLWDACKAKHLACVNLLLETSKNIDLFYNFSYNSKEGNVLTYTCTFVEDETTSCKIVKTLLEYGISPNHEIPISEIRMMYRYCNPEVMKILELYNTKTVIFPSHALHLAVEKGYSKILNLLLEHGAYPDPVILTESGSVLPLYPTLGEHLNPIPLIEHPDVEERDIFEPVLRKILNHDGYLQDIEFLKTLMVHGASLPPHTIIKSMNRSPSIISKQVLFPFDVITNITKRARVTRLARRAMETLGIPSIFPECHYNNCILAMLKLYHQFGGSLWWKMKSRCVPCEGGKGECVEWLRDPGRVTPCKDILQHLRETIPDPEAQSMLVGEVERMMSTPPSLQHSARLAIRRSMGYGCVRNLEALPLPDRLKKYLKFEAE